MFQSITKLFRRESHFERSFKLSSILNDADTVNINDIRDMLQGIGGGGLIELETQFAPPR
jgi:hypothetical protein